MTVPDLEAAAAAMVEAGRAGESLDELMGALACCFARVEPRRQARKYIAGLMSGLPRKNCWTLAQEAGDRTPDRMQRLLERACWDHQAAMGTVARFVAGGLGSGDAVAVIDESDQLKKGTRTAGVKRQYVGCAGRVENAINVVYCRTPDSGPHDIFDLEMLRSMRTCDWYRREQPW